MAQRIRRHREVTCLIHIGLICVRNVGLEHIHIDTETETVCNLLAQLPTVMHVGCDCLSDDQTQHVHLLNEMSYSDEYCKL